MVSDGSAAVEATDSLEEILKKGMTVSYDSVAMYPQLPDNSDIQVEFED